MKELTQHERQERQRQRDAGYALFVAGQGKQLCANDAQRAGWDKAMNDSAYADASAYLVERGLAR